MLLGVLNAKCLRIIILKLAKFFSKQVGTARIIINCEQLSCELPNKQKWVDKLINASKVIMFEIVFLTDVAAIFYG